MPSTLYLFAAIEASQYLRTLSRGFLWKAKVSGLLGFLIHVYFLVDVLIENDGSFQAASRISQFLVTGLAALVALILVFRKKSILVAIILLPLVAISLTVLTWVAERYAPAALPSAWLWTHIGLMVVGEVLFAIAATLAGAYLFIYRKLRRKHGLHVLTSVSSLPALDQTIGVLLNIGFVLLSMGLTLGLLFAHQFWEGDWWKDWKVIFATLIWTSYGLLISMRLALISFRGYRSAVGAVLSFLAILVFSVVLGHYFPSQHLGLPSDSSSFGDQP